MSKTDLLIGTLIAVIGIGGALTVTALIIGIVADRFTRGNAQLVGAPPLPPPISN